MLIELGLIDGGANGGICNGKDMRLMYYHPDDERVNISGVGNHLINNRRLATFCAVVETMNGRFLAIFHNYAYVPEQQGTIHSRIQLQDAGHLVCDTATQLGGLARIDHNDGYRMPICFRRGLPYIKHRPPTDDELATLDQIIMTAPGHWDPSKYDDAHLSSNELMTRIPTTPMDATDDFYDRRGDIDETNRSDQLSKTITWANPLHSLDHDSLSSMPILQRPQPHDDDSSSDDDSSVHSFPPSFDEFSEQPTPPVLILNMETVLSDADDDSNIEEVYKDFDDSATDISSNVEGFQAHIDALATMELDDDLNLDDHIVPPDPPPPTDSSVDPIIPIINGTYRPSIVIEDREGYLAMERNLDGELYYDTFPMFEDIDTSLDIIHDTVEFWNTVEGAPSLHGCSATRIDTIDDTSYLNDLSAPRPTESDYWDGYFTLDDPTLRILSHAVVSDAAKYDINKSDITNAMHPLKPRITRPSKIDYESKRQYFGWLPLENVKRTFEYCTQNMRLPPSTHLQKRFKSPNPGANLIHQREPDATDLIYCDTPAIDGGETMAHIFVGTISRVTDVFKAKRPTAECFLGALQDRIHIRGAPTKLLTNNAGMYRSWRITRYLRDIWTSL